MTSMHCLEILSEYILIVFFGGPDLGPNIGPSPNMKFLKNFPKSYLNIPNHKFRKKFIRRI